MTRPSFGLIFTMALGVGVPALSQPHSSTLPATQPAATQAARRTLAMPPGFGRVEGQGFVVLCQDADAQWVREALAEFTAATRPTTMPADLLTRVAAQRTAVVDMMVRDLALKDRAPVEQAFDQTIVPELRHLDEFRPPVFYLVTSKPVLKDLIKNETWSDPQFYYNRLADDVLFTEAVPLSMDKPMDDTVMPALYDATWDAAQRKAHLIKSLRDADRELQQAISGRAQFQCHMALIEFMMKSVFEPMDLKPGQRWLGMGAAGMLSCDYAQMLTGASRQEMLAMLVVEVRRNPVPTAAIDLLHPLEPKMIRKQFVNAYSDAFRRKAVLVARKWIEKGGRESLTRVLEAMRKDPPADGEALLAIIKADSGVDLTADARSK